MRLTQADNENRKPLFEIYIGILVKIIDPSLETHTFTTYVTHTCYNVHYFLLMKRSHIDWKEEL